MREGTILICGGKKNVAVIEEMAFRRFGGFSTYQGAGAWVDAMGQIHREAHIRLTVSGAGNEVNAFLDFATQWLIAHGGEQAVYTVSDGYSEIKDARDFIGQIKPKKNAR